MTNDNETILFCGTRIKFDTELYGKVTISDMGVRDIPKDRSEWSNEYNYNRIKVKVEFPMHLIPSWNEIMQYGSSSGNCYVSYNSYLGSYIFYVSFGLKSVNTSLKFALDEVANVVDRIKNQRKTFANNLKLREETINASKIELENLNIIKTITDTFY